MSVTWKTDKRIVCATEDENIVVVLRQVAGGQNPGEENLRYVLSNSKTVEVVWEDCFVIPDTGSVLHRLSS